MDSIKIIVTNSDTTSITSTDAHYQHAPNEALFKKTKSFDDISDKLQVNNEAKSKSSNHWNVPPLKLSKTKPNTFSIQKNENNDQSNVYDSKKPLLSAQLGKSFVSSQSTSSLGTGKKMKILPSSLSTRIATTATGKKKMHRH